MQVDRATVDANMARIHASLSPAELEALAEAGDEVYSVSSASPDNVEAAQPVKSAETIAAEEVATDAAAAGAKAADTEPQAGTTEAKPAAETSSVVEAPTTAAFVTIKQEDVDKASSDIDAAKQVIASVDAEKAELRKKLDAGELSSAEYVDGLDAIAAKRDVARDSISKAERLIERHSDQVEMRNQAMQRDFDNAYKAFTSEAEHRLYADSKMAEGLFRQAVGQVGRELVEKKEEWTARQIFAEAHARIAKEMPALFAKPVPAAAPAAAPTKEARPTGTPKPPVSIAAMPAASSPAVTGKFAHLEGMTVGQLENALARMSVADREEYEALV